MTESTLTPIALTGAIYLTGVEVRLSRRYNGGDRCSITDLGGGYVAAQLIGVDAEYLNQAERIAKDAGMVVSDGVVIAPDVLWDRQDVAAKWVAHVSTVALSLAMYLTEHDHSPNERG